MIITIIIELNLDIRIRGATEIHGEQILPGNHLY